MALNGIPTPWARLEDWAEYRTIITDLYVIRRKKMKEVIQIMAEEYDFHATQKMYKMRFKKWGVTKNISSNPACVKDVRPSRVSGPGMNTTESSETDQKSKRIIVTPKRSTRRITSLGSIRSPQHLSTKLAIRTMTPPDCYKFAEGTLHLAQVYVSSIRFPNLGSAISNKKLVTAASSAEWLNCVITAKTLLALGHFQRATLVIDICCHQYRSLLDSQDLSLMAVTVVAILKVLHYWPRLAEAFLNFICQMSRTVLGTYHLLSMLFQKLMEAGVDHLAYCIAMTLQHFLGGIVHVMPHPMMASYGDFYNDMFHGQFIDASTVLSEIQHLQHRLNHPPRVTQSHFFEDTTAIKCRLAWLYIYGMRYEDATKLMWGMLSDPLVDIHVTTGCYDILYDIALVENNHDRALYMIQRAVEASVKAYGYIHSTTARIMARLESCLRRMGRLPEAEKVHSDSEVQLREICEKARRLRI
ncbi:Clr5 domain-containing protein [Hypoxylon argillaceum]|nr:Clr5 domain-containing protein [Hypoxylon argillaceum]